MTRPVRALINTAALRHNLQRVRQAAPGHKVMAVVKANGYGHGLIRVARALEDTDAFAVARLDEAVQLRDAGVDKPVILLSGIERSTDLAEIRARGLDIVVHSEHQVAMLESAPGGPRTRVWLKIDTGMHRLGFPMSSAPESYQQLAGASQAVASVGLMTHLADADNRSDARVGQQIKAFGDATSGIDAERTIANSGGVLGWPASHADWVRPGIMLYGITPFDAGSGADQGLRPVMTLETRLIAVSRVSRGERIGYGGTYFCPRDMLVGVAAVGYGDGYPRQAPSGTPVLVEGVRCTLAGRVSMDMVTINLDPLPSARPGMRVVAWGDALAAEEVAACCGTIAYELLSRLPQRVSYAELER